MKGAEKYEIKLERERKKKLNERTGNKICKDKVACINSTASNTAIERGGQGQIGSAGTKKERKNNQEETLQKLKGKEP